MWLAFLLSASKEYQVLQRDYPRAHRKHQAAQCFPFDSCCFGLILVVFASIGCLEAIYAYAKPFHAKQRPVLVFLVLTLFSLTVFMVS